MVCCPSTCWRLNVSQGCKNASLLKVVKYRPATAVFQFWGWVCYAYYISRYRFSCVLFVAIFIILIICIASLCWYVLLVYSYSVRLCLGFELVVLATAYDKSQLVKYCNLNINKNLAIVNRLHVSCAHNMLRAFMGLNITPWPWNVG